MIVRRIQSGKAADVILVPDDGLRLLATAGRIAGESMTAVASLARRRGGVRRRQTLLRGPERRPPRPGAGRIERIAYPEDVERLGIADTLAAKSILSSHLDREDQMPAARVARGEAEIALHQVRSS